MHTGGYAYMISVNLSQKRHMTWLFGVKEGINNSSGKFCIYQLIACKAALPKINHATNICFLHCHRNNAKHLHKTQIFLRVLIIYLHLLLPFPALLTIVWCCMFKRWEAFSLFWCLVSYRFLMKWRSQSGLVVQRLGLSPYCKSFPGSVPTPAFLWGVCMFSLALHRFSLGTLAPFHSIKTKWQR